MSRVPNAVQAAAAADVWRRGRSCRRYAPGSPVKIATAAVAPAHRAATPAAVRQAIVDRPAASRSAPVRVAKAVLPAAARTVASVVKHAALPVARATVRTALVLRMAVVRKARARAKAKAIVHRGTPHTATPGRKARAVRDRKARVAIVRKVLAGLRARVAIVHTVVRVHRVTVVLLVDVHQDAAAIVRAIAELPLGVTDQGH